MTTSILCHSGDGLHRRHRQGIRVAAGRSRIERGTSQPEPGQVAERGPRDLQTTPRTDRDQNRDGGLHVVGGHRVAGGHVRRGAPRTRRAARQAVDQQRGPDVRAATTVARHATLLHAAERGRPIVDGGRARRLRRRPVSRRGRVQRAGRRGHVSHSDAADVAGQRPPRGAPGPTRRQRRRKAAAVAVHATPVARFVHVAIAVPAASDGPGRRRHQRVVRLGAAAVSVALRVRRHKGLVMIETWSREERAFAVESYFSSGHSIMAIQRAFRKHFNIAPADSVPYHQSIVIWVETFRAGAFLSKFSAELAAEYGPPGAAEKQQRRQPSIAVRCLTPGFLATKLSRIRSQINGDTGWTYAPRPGSYARYSLRSLDCHCACRKLRCLRRDRKSETGNRGRKSGDGAGREAGHGWLAGVIGAVFLSPSSPFSAGQTGIATTGYPSHTLMVFVVEAARWLLGDKYVYSAVGRIMRRNRDRMARRDANRLKATEVDGKQ